MEQKKKNENLVTMLLEAFEKGMKKTSEAKEKSQTKMTVEEEIKSLTNSIKHLSDIITHHNVAINELYLLQSHVLKQLKASSSLDSLGKISKATKKNNDEKPN